MDEKQKRTYERMLLGFLPDDKIPLDLRQMVAVQAIAFELSEIRKRMDRLLEILEKSQPK